MSTINRIQILFLTLLFPLLCLGQEMKSSGTSAEAIVPEGWTYAEATGDLNKDGIADLAIVVRSDLQELYVTDDDGEKYNQNPTSLYLYKGGPDGQFQLWKIYKESIPFSDSNNMYIDYDVSISDKGALTIGTSISFSAGSWGNYNDSYVFRYQQGEFCLIGEEHDELARNTGKVTHTSINYLTHKKWVSHSNAFEEDSVEKKVWKKIPNAPLRILGKDIKMLGE